GGRERVDRLPRLGLPPHHALGADLRPCDARTAGMLRRSPAGPCLLDRAHARPRPGALPELGPDALPRGDGDRGDDVNATLSMADDDPPRCCAACDPTCRW